MSPSHSDNIFRKSENFPKIWKLSANLENFQKSENFQKIRGQVVTLIKCLKGHKSLGLLFNCQLGHEGDGAGQTDQQTDRQWNLLSCLETAKILNVLIEEQLIMQYLKALDKDNSGYITEKEMRSIWFLNHHHVTIFVIQEYTWWLYI